MWNGVPAPASVMSWRASIGMVSAGTNVSVRIRRAPVSNELINHTCPPMWEKGNTIATLSSPVIARPSIIVSAAASTLRSVCCAPLGSAVVPDV